MPIDRPRRNRSLTLYSGPEKMPPQPQGGLANASGGDRQSVEYRWELEPLQLAPGMQIEFYAEASDYLPQTGRSDVRRLIVVTPRELARSAGRAAESAGRRIAARARPCSKRAGSKSKGCESACRN